jgi:hypothetical protein
MKMLGLGTSSLFNNMPVTQHLLTQKCRQVLTPLVSDFSTITGLIILDYQNLIFPLHAHKAVTVIVIVEL